MSRACHLRTGERDQLSGRWVLASPQEILLRDCGPWMAGPSPATRQHERRVASRVPCAELSWIDTVWLRGSGPVTPIDISSTGALLECGQRIMPGGSVTLLLRTNGRDIAVPARVVRSFVHTIMPADGFHYRVGVAFQRGLSPGLFQREFAPTDAPRGRADRVRPLERRAHRRVKGPFDAGWSHREGPRLPTRVTDVSETACFVASQACASPDALVSVWLAVPELGELAMRGKITRVDPPFGFVVQFVELDAAHQRALRVTAGRLSGRARVADLPETRHRHQVIRVEAEWKSRAERPACADAAARAGQALAAAVARLRTEAEEALAAARAGSCLVVQHGPLAALPPVPPISGAYGWSHGPDPAVSLALTS